MKNALATIRIRRGIGKEVKPEAEQLEGQAYTFRFGWLMTDSDPYPGENAWIPMDANWPEDAPVWIAAGDLEFKEQS